MTNTGKSAFWKRHIENQSNSRQTQILYCREKGLNLNTFYCWKRKLQNTTSKAAKPAQITNAPTCIGERDKQVLQESKSFIPLQLKPEKKNLIEFSLNEDTELSFTLHTSVATIKANIICLKPRS